MAGINLAAIGAGLGQFAQQYRQQQEMAQRQQLQRLYMQKQADEQAALAIQANTLAAGGLGGLGGLPGGFQPVGGPPQGAPAPPTGPQAPAASPAMPAAVAANGQGPLVRSEAPIEREDLTPNAGMSVTGPQGHGIGTGVPTAPGTEDTVEGRQTYAPPAEATSQAGVRTNSIGEKYGKDGELISGPAGGGAGAPAPADQANAQPVLQAPGGQQIDLASFMHRADPVELMQRIKMAAPNATPQQQMLALNGLYKIYQSDNKTEQMLLAKVLGFNVGMARIGATERGQDLAHGDRVTGQAISKQRADTAARQGDQRIAQGNTRIQQAQARLEQAKGISDRGQRTSALRALIVDIDKMIQPGGLNQPPDAETLKGLQAQRAAIIAELNKPAGIAPVGQ